MKIPIFCRKFFMHIADNREYIYNFCNNLDSKFQRHCFEWYLCNNTDEDEY